MGPSAAVQAEVEAGLIGGAEFDSFIKRLGPFERAPALAAAVSGGADSMALALLADEWARARGGTVTALIVDHGLRPESGREAATVVRWLKTRGVPSVVLRWEGEKPVSGVQEAARAVRYRLLTRWCREAGTLHLLLAHHRDDQIETTVLRAARGSGPDGLAGMSAIAEQADCRILRPLLAVPGARLRATLRALRQDWIEDPSNRNPAFARVRVRAGLAQQQHPAPDEPGRARIRTEAALARLLAQSVAIYPEGWALVDPEPWRTEPQLAGRALVRVLLAIGGAVYPPRGERLEPLLKELLQGLPSGRTLAGCRLIPRGETVLVTREAGRIASAEAEEGRNWDNRFAVILAGTASASVRLADLGQRGWREVLAVRPEIRATAPPFPIPLTLPALFDLEGVRAVPHLMYGRQGADPDSVRVVSAMFRPSHALAGPGFAQI
jgi:tRNA(Ile)-lysidine synthase